MKDASFTTPPSELFKQREGQPRSLVFEAAYCAGADAELEACCAWMEAHFHGRKEWGDALRAARRPKPPSLAAQALEALGQEPFPETDPTWDTILNAGAIRQHRLVRRALERLQELENNG